jgi:hypothetical protein
MKNLRPNETAALTADLKIITSLGANVEYDWKVIIIHLLAESHI